VFEGFTLGVTLGDLDGVLDGVDVGVCVAQHSLGSDKQHSPSHPAACQNTGSSQKQQESKLLHRSLLPKKSLHSNFVGFLDGTNVGVPTGPNVGVALGVAVGSLVGNVDGLIVGIFVGDTL